MRNTDRKVFPIGGPDLQDHGVESVARRAVDVVFVVVVDRYMSVVVFDINIAIATGTKSRLAIVHSMPNDITTISNIKTFIKTNIDHVVAVHVVVLFFVTSMIMCLDISCRLRLSHRIPCTC